MNTRTIIAIGIAAAASGVLLWYYHFRNPAQGPAVQVENGFEFAVAGPFPTVAPLFGALRERVWAGDQWNPRFVYPQPARDVEGEVFTVKHGHLHAIWVNTALDLENGHIQYVYVIPNAQAVLIDIHLRPLGPSSTDVKVVYQRTSLRPELNQHVTELGEKDRGSAKEWETAINTYLKSQPAK